MRAPFGYDTMGTCGRRREWGTAGSSPLRLRKCLGDGLFLTISQTVERRELWRLQGRVGGCPEGPEGPEGPKLSPPFPRVKPTMRNGSQIERSGLGGRGVIMSWLDSTSVPGPSEAMSTETSSSISVSDSRSLGALSPSSEISELGAELEVPS